MKTSKKLRKRIIDQAIKDLVKGGLTSLTMPLLAQEVKVADEEIAKYFSSKEEVLVAQQERLWKAQFSKTNKLIKKAKTPADYKEIFEAFFDNLVASIRENDHIQFEVFSFVPACLQYRAKTKIRLKKYFLKIIKKGWPGKTPEVLDRQTDLLLLTLYGFLDHIVHISASERKKILKDYKNMLNLHLANTQPRSYTT